MRVYVIRCSQKADRRHPFIFMWKTKRCYEIAAFEADDDTWMSDTLWSPTPRCTLSWEIRIWCPYFLSNWLYQSLRLSQVSAKFICESAAKLYQYMLPTTKMWKIADSFECMWEYVILDFEDLSCFVFVRWKNCHIYVQ